MAMLVVSPSPLVRSFGILAAEYPDPQKFVVSLILKVGCREALRVKGKVDRKGAAYGAAANETVLTS